MVEGSRGRIGRRRRSLDQIREANWERSDDDLASLLESIVELACYEDGCQGDLLWGETQGWVRSGHTPLLGSKTPQLTWPVLPELAPI